MAMVPVSQGATVDSRPAPFVPQNTQFDPNAFGAGIGRAEQGLGQSVGQVADEGAKIATNMAIDNDQRAAKVSDTQHQKNVTDLGFTSLPDGPAGNKGYYSLQGQDAVTYRPAYEKALNDSNTAIADGLKDSPRAQNFYNNQAGMRVSAEVQRSSEYAMHQGLVADNNASGARLSAYKDSLTVNYNDPTALANFEKVTRGEVADTGRRMGWGTDQIAEATTKALSGGYRDAILARASSGDIAGASEMLNNLKPGMDAATRVQLQQHLEPQLLGAQADAMVAAKMGTAPAGNQSLPRGIRNNNPGNLNFANQDGAMLENHENARFAAFPTMQQGVDALGHQIKSDNSRGYDTISKLISKYAPPSENDTLGYIASLSKSTGFSPDQKLDTSDPAVLGALQSGIIAHENGGQYRSLGRNDGSYQIAGPPVGNASDANPAIHPDFAGMQQQFLDETAGNPKLQNAVLNRLHTAANQYELSTQADRDQIGKTWKDTVASATAGNDTVPVNEAMIRHVFRPGVADSMMNEFHEAVTAGQLNGALKMATPSQVNSIMTGLSAAQQNEDPTRFVQRQKALASAQSFLSQRQKALTDDPAAYVMQDPNVAAAYKAIDQSKPETIQAAADASLSSQRTLGVAEPRILDTASAAAMVKKIETPTQGDMGKALNDLEKSYGSHYGDVISDLTKAGLSPRYQQLAHSNLPEQATVSHDAQIAFQMFDGMKDKSEWSKGVPADQEKLLRPAVDLAVAPYRQTLQGSTDPHNTIGTVIIPAITQTAQYYMMHGMPAQAAVDKAAGLINMSYKFDDELRVPAAPGMPTVSQVRGGMATLTNGLNDADLRGTTAAEARDGTWMTNPDDKGATLFKGTTQGGYMPVRKADGSYLSVDFKKLPSAGPAIPAPGQAAVMNTGLN